MKIVNYMVAFELKAGGVTRAVLDLCTVLAGRGHDVTLLTCGDEDVPEQWKASGNGLPQLVTLERRRLPLPHLPRASMARVEQCLAGADVLHLHGPWDPVCVQLARAAERAGIPYVVSLHGMLDDWTIGRKALKKRLYLALLGRRMLERAGAVQCTAGGERDQSAPRFPAGRPVVVPLVFDLDPFRELPGPQRARDAWPEAFTGALTVLFVGRLHPIKRIEMLMEAVASCTGADLRLVIAGSGDRSYEKSLSGRAGELGIAPRTVFTGFVSGPDKVSLYEAADVFVLPSHHENWGFVAFEALACRTPVVTTRDVISWPEVQASGGAIIAEPRADAIADALKSLMADPARRTAMGEAGRSWVLDALDLDSISEQYEALYREARRGPG